MGWKSTIDVSRSEAKKLIRDFLNKLDDVKKDGDDNEEYIITNRELGDALDGILGDNSDLPHFGNNFIVLDDDDERFEREQYERLKRKFE